MKTIEELEAQLETVTRERDEARAYAEDRNDEANKLQRCLNMAATERDEAREQAKAYNDNAYALSLGVDQLTKERDEARSLLTQARVAVEHERDRLSDCEHDPAFCTCDEAARTSVLLAKIDAMIVDPSEMRRLRILERDEARAEVEKLSESAKAAWEAECVMREQRDRYHAEWKQERQEVERLRTALLEVQTSESAIAWFADGFHDGWKAGAEAMREACIGYAHKIGFHGLTVDIRALPIPEEP